MTYEQAKAMVRKLIAEGIYAYYVELSDGTYNIVIVGDQR